MTESRLFKPLRIGNVHLKHRVAMAPLTRLRNTGDFIPTTSMKEYYSQRASVAGTLLIAEATVVAPRALGSPHVPGLWSEAQIKAWREITDAVHEKGSFIYTQLWAQGRTVSADVTLAAGFDVVSSSPLQLDENHSEPRELTISEIKLFIADFAQAARNAIAAGFDGVEIHAAHGYLIDQFTQDTVNSRTDEYGGSIENRSRFAIEVTQAVVDTVGPERTAIRFSPWSGFQGMRMEDPIPQFTYLISELKGLKLSYLHLVEPRVHGSSDVVVKETGSLEPFIRAWDRVSPVLVAGGFDSDSAKTAADELYRDIDAAIVFGRYFISTPDLPFRIQKGLALNKYDRSTFYSNGLEGYTDYAFSEEFKKEVGVAA